MRTWNSIRQSLVGKQVTLPNLSDCDGGVGTYQYLNEATFSVPSKEGFKFHADIVIEATLYNLYGGFRAEYDTWRTGRVTDDVWADCDSGVTTMLVTNSIAFGYEQTCGRHPFKLLVRSGDGNIGSFSGVKVKVKSLTLTAIAGASGSVADANCGAGCGPANGDNSHSLASANYDLQSVHFALPIGRPGPSATNFSVGALFIHEPLVRNELFTPQCLNLSPDGYYEDVVRTTNGWIRQVKAVEGLADVVVVSSNVYEIRVYGCSNVVAKSAGLWVTTNSPSATYRIEKAATINDVRFVATHGGVARTNHYTWITTNSNWSLNRSDVRWDVLVNTTGSNGPVVTRVTRPSLTATNLLVTEVRYTNFGWGNVAVETRNGDGVSKELTTFEYESATNSSAYRMPKKIQSSDGDWAWAGYDSSGRLVELRKPFAGQPFTSNTNLCSVTVFDYTPLSGSGDSGDQAEVPRMEVEYALGVEIGRRYRIVKSDEEAEIQCAFAGASWNASSNLVRTTRFYTNGTFATMPKSELSLDGTLTLYEYASGASYRTNTVSRGQANSNNTVVLAGVRTVTVLGASGYDVSSAMYDVASGIQLSGITFDDFDEFGRGRRRSYFDGTYDQVVYGCCGLESETDRDGVTTEYDHDAAGRVSSVTRNGITEVREYDAAGRVVKSRRLGTDGSVAMEVSEGFDTLNRLIASTNALGGVSSISYSTNVTGQSVITTTLPDGGTKVETYYLGGQLCSLGGTSVAPVRYHHGVELESGTWRRYSVEVRLGSGASDTNEWTKTFYDMLDRPYRTEYATGTTNKVYRQTWYDSKGRPWKERDPDGVITLREYNGQGEVLHTAVDVDQDDVIDLGGPDRVVRSERDVLTLNSVPVQRTRQWVYPSSTNNTTMLTREDWISTDGLKSGATTFGQTQSSQTVLVRTSQTRTVTSTLSDGGTNVAVSVSGRVVSGTRYSSNGTVVATSTHSYDAHGRQSAVTDGRSGTSTITYNAADLVVSTTSPPPGNGQSALTSGTEYDSSLRAWRITHPEGATVTNEYHPTGALKKTYGSRTYPVEYTYDTQGRMKTLKTWQNFSGNSGTAITTWSYDPYRGWLVAKDYANASTGVAGTVGTDYTYTDGGRLRTRTWARTYNGSTRIATTYSYGFNDGSGGNEHGDLVSVSYNDGSTPATTFSYDRLGRQTTIARNGMTTTRQYHDSGISLGESHSGG